jgi:hypothetical protein
MPAIDNKPQYGENITQTEHGDMAKPSLPFQQWIDAITRVVDSISQFIESRRLMSFRGLWLSERAPWRRNDVVYDEGWTMIANRLTSDRAAPVAIGDPANALPDVPVWNTEQTAGTVQSGQRYSVFVSGWIQNVRVWLPDVTQIDYKLGIIVDPNSENPERSEFPIVPINANEWTTVFSGVVFMNANTDVILYLEADTQGQTQYVEIPNYWAANQPAFASVVGQLAFDGVPQLGFEDSAFGVDVTFQPAIISDDWSLVATSESGV